MNALKRLNDGLPSLVVTILIYGLLIVLIGIWFVDDKIRYLTGTVFGISLAIYMAVSIASVVRTVVESENEVSVGRLRGKAVFRYLIVFAVLCIMLYFNLGSLIPAFLGVLGLKICSYLQPPIHKYLLHDWEYSDAEPIEYVEEEEK